MSHGIIFVVGKNPDKEFFPYIANLDAVGNNGLTEEQCYEGAVCDGAVYYSCLPNMKTKNYTNKCKLKEIDMGFMTLLLSNPSSGIPKAPVPKKKTEHDFPHINLEGVLYDGNWTYFGGELFGSKCKFGYEYIPDRAIRFLISLPQNLKIGAYDCHF